MKKMTLVDVYDEKEAPKILYELLKEREPHMNISHQSLPKYEDHLAFFNKKPYKDWFLIKKDVYIGSLYVTKANEIGLFIFKKYHRKGYGSEALELLFENNPNTTFLANISPHNQVSIDFFTKKGFKHIQNTYKLVK